MKLLVEVTAYSLHRRKGPAVTFDTISYLQRGDRGYVVEEQNGWYRWEIGGWSNKNFVKVIKNMEETPPPSKTPTTPPKTPAPSPTPPPPSINYDDVANALGGDGDVTPFKQFSGGSVTGTPSSDALKTKSIASIGSDFPSGVEIIDYELDYSFIEQNLDIVRQNLNIIGERKHENMKEVLFQKFNRFKTAFPDIHLTKSFSYVFFTRPDLNILDSSGLLPQFKNDPTFYYLYQNNPKLLKSLTKELDPSHDFHPFLSNSAESFELSDEFIKTIEHGETLTGYKIQYGKHNIESNSAGTFSVSYTDDSDFAVYKTHKAWMEYISKVYRGEVSPKRDYIVKKILDYACSVYYFICGPDGETILFWAKYFGVFPTNTPSSASSWVKGSQVKLPQFTINYAYSFKEDCNPLSLAEFNMNSRADLVYKKTYEPLLLSTGRTLSGAPFIETGKDSAGHYVYKLRFRKS